MWDPNSYKGFFQWLPEWTKLADDLICIMQVTQSPDYHPKGRDLMDIPTTIPQNEKQH